MIDVSTMARSLSWASVCWMIFGPGSVHAQDVAAQQAALKAINETAANICTGVPTEGNGREVDLSGSAQAKLAGVLSKVANLGVDGAAKYQSTQYRGVLQQQLADAIKNSNDCRLTVFSTLVAKLLPSTTQPPNPGPQPQPPGPDPGKKIGFGPFAVGDTVEAIKQSGIQGTFSTGPKGETLFSFDTRVPIKTGEYSSINQQATITYVLERGIITVAAVEFGGGGDCQSQGKWIQPLYSQMVFEMGEPTAGPTKSHKNALMGGRPTINDITNFVFENGNERREFEQTNMTNPTDMSRQACVVEVDYSKR